MKFSVNTTQAAQFLKLTECDLVRWLRGEGLNVGGVTMAVTPPTVTHQGSKSRRICFLDLQRCEKEISRRLCA